MACQVPNYPPTAFGRPGPAVSLRAAVAHTAKFCALSDRHFQRLICAPEARLYPPGNKSPIMSQSPSSAGAMGIGNVLNIKAEPGLHQSQQPGAALDNQQRQPPQLHQLQMDRQNSPHGSEQSRYSGPMNASYPSPTAMAAAPLPPVPSANMAPAPMVPHELHPNLPHEMHPNLMPGMSPSGFAPIAAPAQTPTKQFPCSTCGKPFARRSDLARHGMHQNPAFCTLVPLL